MTDTLTNIINRAYCYTTNTQNITESMGILTSTMGPISWKFMSTSEQRRRIVCTWHIFWNVRQGSYSQLTMIRSWNSSWISMATRKKILSLQNYQRGNHTLLCFDLPGTKSTHSSVGTFGTVPNTKNTCTAILSSKNGNGLEPKEFPTREHCVRVSLCGSPKLQDYMLAYCQVSLPPGW